MYTVRGRLKDKYFLSSLIITIIVIVISRSPYAYPLLFIPVAVGLVRIVLPILRQKMRIAIADINLLFLLLHLYAIATGKPTRRRLFEPRCIVGRYGEYETILRRIAVLAVEWGYGFVKAIRMIAGRVKNGLFRDFLLRFSEVLRTGEDVEAFLDVEYRALRRNFQAQYYRSMDVMRIVLGLYTTLMSSAAFVIIVVTVLMLFAGADTVLYTLVVIGASGLIAIFAIITYLTVPKEWLTPKVKPKPKAIYRGYKIALVTGLILMGILSYITYTTFKQLEYVLAMGALPLTLPGLMAKRIEHRIKRIESFYPIFIRSFGLTYSVIPHQAKAMQSILMSDFGPLTPALKRVYARLTNGVDPHTAWRYFIFDTWSDLITKCTNIMVDSVDAGGNTQTIGTTLSDIFTRILDLRNMRERTARVFEVTVYLLQILTTGIVTTIIFLIEQFSNYMQAFTTIAGFQGLMGVLPLSVVLPNLPFITNVTICFLAFLTVVNALTIKVAYGGIPETFWIQLSLLLMLTSGAVTVMRILVQTLFGRVFMIPVP